MDCDSDDGELMPKVFAVDDDGDDVDLSVPPTSGQEYLRRVMWVLSAMTVMILNATVTVVQNLPLVAMLYGECC